MVNDMGQRIALSLHGLSDHKAFRKHLRQAIDRGLSPSGLGRHDHRAGRNVRSFRSNGHPDSGKWANLCVVEGDCFDPQSPIREIRVQGRRYPIQMTPSNEEGRGIRIRLKKCRHGGRQLTGNSNLSAHRSIPP